MNGIQEVNGSIPSISTKRPESERFRSFTFLDTQAVLFVSNIEIYFEFVIAFDPDRLDELRYNHTFAGHSAVSVKVDPGQKSLDILLNLLIELTAVLKCFLMLDNIPFCLFHSRLAGSQELIEDVGVEFAFSLNRLDDLSLVKAQIARAGWTLTNIVNEMNKSRNVDEQTTTQNISNKLSRGTIKYAEVLEIADIIGYQIKWELK